MHYCSNISSSWYVSCSIFSIKQWNLTLPKHLHFLKPSIYFLRSSFTSPPFVLFLSSSFLCGWLVSLCCAAGWVCVSRFIRRPLLLYAAGTEPQEPGDDRPLDANKLTVDVSWKFDSTKILWLHSNLTPSYPGRMNMTSFIEEIMLETCHVLLV